MTRLRKLTEVFYIIILPDAYSINFLTNTSVQVVNMTVNLYRSTYMLKPEMLSHACTGSHVNTEEVSH